MFVEQPSSGGRLSKRELEIVGLAAEGLTDKEIAKRLGIAMGSVRTYWERMRRKIDARNRAELLVRVLGNAQAIRDAQDAQSVLKVIIENSGVAMAIVDEQGEFRQVNPAMDKLLSQIEESPKNFCTAFLGGSQSELNELFEAGSSVRTVPIRVKGATRVWQERIVSLNIQGEKLLLVNFVEGFLSLHSEEGRGSSAMIKSNPVPVCVVTRKGVVLAASAAFVSLVKRPVWEIVGRQLSHVLSLEKGDTILSDLHAAIVKGSVCATWTLDDEAGMADVEITNRLNDPKLRALWLVFSVARLSTEAPLLQVALPQ